MSDEAAPFREFLRRALEGAGLDRKSFAKAMGGNPSKFYRRYDSWVKGKLDVAGTQRYEVPDLPNIQRMAPVLGVDEAAVLQAVRAQLAHTDHTMTDAGKIIFQPAVPPANPLDAELGRSEPEQSLASALADPFLPGDPPAALYWLWRCALEGDEAGLAQVKHAVAQSPSRMVRDAVAVVKVG